MTKGNILQTAFLTVKDDKRDWYSCKIILRRKSILLNRIINIYHALKVIIVFAPLAMAAILWNWKYPEVVQVMVLLEDDASCRFLSIHEGKLSQVLKVEKANKCNMGLYR